MLQGVFSIFIEVDRPALIVLGAKIDEDLAIGKNDVIKLYFKQLPDPHARSK